MKTKNVPYGLKCKINTNFFFCKQDVPKGGGGGGGPAIWDKFPKNVVFFLTCPLRAKSIALYLIKNVSGSPLYLFEGAKSR